MRESSVKYSNLDLSKNNTPYSKEFDDCYYSDIDGLEETKYIFLAGNNLPQAWQGKDTFTIIETGFGTGLNFFATCNLWLESTKEGILHYLSIEKFPLKFDDLKKANENWTEFNNLINELERKYPALIPGFHRISLCDNRIMLTLIIGDINDVLPQISATADAWFLDGFTPDKNPEMWSDELFKFMARLSSTGSSFATFTAATSVRRGLEENGFEIKKLKGFGKKREMLTGLFSEQSNESKSETPWYIYPKSQGKDVVIIGGGLAGTSAAYSLSKRNYNVTLIEKHKEIANEASGNPAGILFPYIANEWDNAARFYLTAQNFTSNRIDDLIAQGNKIAGESCGILQFGKKQRDKERIKNIPNNLGLTEDFARYVEREKACNIAGIEVNEGALYFPEGRWVSAKDLCQAQANSINTIYETNALKLTKHKDKWQVISDGDVILSADIVVIANAENALDFEQSNHLPIDKIRGQLSYLPTNKSLEKLNTILCYGGYVTPAIDGQHYLGASYKPDNHSNELLQEENEENLNLLNEYCNIEIPTGNLEGRVAFRAVSADRMPIIGQLPIIEDFFEHYGDLHHGKHWKDYPQGSYHEGLYITTGHGSRGLLSCPIGGEIIASLINNEPTAIAADLINALNPARFTIRDLQKMPEDRRKVSSSFAKASADTGSRF